MKKIITGLLSLLSYLIYAQQAVIPQSDNNGGLFFQFANVLFHVNQNHGARIDSCKLDGTEFMWVEQVSGINDMYGSTAWLSPQNLWNWPPQKQVDTDPYTGGIQGNKIILTSATASAGTFKFQIRKTFTADLQDTSVTVNYTVINKTTSAKSIASWEIMRVPTGGMSVFPVNGSITGELSPVFIIQDNIAWWDYDSTQNIFNKAFADGRDGWLAHIDNNRIIQIKKFNDAASNFPPNTEKEIEFWHESGRHYVEIEKHSEYRSVPAGDSTNLSMKWFLRKLPENIAVTKGNPDILSYIENIVNTSSSGIGEIRNNTGIIPYPNPCKGFLSFRGLKNDEKYEFSLYNVLGELEVSRTIYGNESIDLSSFNKGIYLYRIRSRGSFTTGKLTLCN